MTFEILPTIDIMLNLYQLPRTQERFQAYIKLLQGNTKNDLLIPISGYNPMAKEPLIAKLNELKKMDAESIIVDTLKELNSGLVKDPAYQTCKVALNLCDDVDGGWTNRFTTDYDSKFKINGLLHKNFCTPIFWASEQYTPVLIKERTMEYVYRTLYRETHSTPISLQQHVAQEIFVYQKMNIPFTIPEPDFDLLDKFYADKKDHTAHDLLFNFFYGNTAAASLGHSIFDIKTSFTGFDYCKAVVALSF